MPTMPHVRFPICELARLLLCAASLAGVIGFTGEARAEPAVCGPSRPALAFLKARYQEVPIQWRSTGHGLLVITASEGGLGTWTAMRLLDGMACHIAQGSDWRAVRIAAEGVPV